ncbi:flagellar biosynthesis protein FlhA [Pseudaeromonas pectinilytica]
MEDKAVNNRRGLFSGGALGSRSDLAIVLLSLLILGILFVPLPKPFLDFLLICNVSLALLILLVTFYADKPLKFSTFPSILLIVTLFRLALNISTTRLILSDADAGKVIKAVGAYVIGGNYVVGVVVFVILVIVQYVVITNGAQRVAEVAARFTLDSMPGKQMSIDADLNMGIIDDVQAQERRQEIQQEANFYGAMDGATKFVKGDAIAGIIIIFVNIIAGLLIGVNSHQMSWGVALQTYTLLTVGDGIITQIPSLVIATATGIIITRAATDAKLGSEVINQLTSHPGSLLMLACGLTVTLFLPGIPAVPVGCVLVPVLVLIFYSYTNHKNNLSEAGSGSDAELNASSDTVENAVLRPIEIKLGSIAAKFIEAQRDSFTDKINNFRKQFALESGFVVPSVSIEVDPMISSAVDYQIYIFGVSVGRGEIRDNDVLAIAGGAVKVELEGEKTKDPTYGLPAIWIDKKRSTHAREHGFTIVEPETMLLTHLTDVIKRHSHELLTRAELQNLFNKNKVQTQDILAEMIPSKISMAETQRVFQSLLKEQVPIRNVSLILETLSECVQSKKGTVEELCESIRKRLGSAICQQLLNKANEVDVLTFDGQTERALISAVNPPERLAAFNIEPVQMEKVIAGILASCQRMMAKGKMPVLLCAPILRLKIKQITERSFPRLVVLSMLEIPNSITIKSHEVIRVNFPGDNR